VGECLLVMDAGAQRVGRWRDFGTADLRARVLGERPLRARGRVLGKRRHGRRARVRAEWLPGGRRRGRNRAGGSAGDRRERAGEKGEAHDTRHEPAGNRSAGPPRGVARMHRFWAQGLAVAGWALGRHRGDLIGDDPDGSPWVAEPVLLSGTWHRGRERETTLFRDRGPGQDPDGPG
jgi:hypothetical protein